MKKKPKKNFVWVVEIGDEPGGYMPTVDAALTKADAIARLRTWADIWPYRRVRKYEAVKKYLEVKS